MNEVSNTYFSFNSQSYVSLHFTLYFHHCSMCIFLVFLSIPKGMSFSSLKKESIGKPVVGVEVCAQNFPKN